MKFSFFIVKVKVVLINLLSNKVKGGSKPLDPKVPQSPAFYSSSDMLDSSTLRIISSKEGSSNDSQKQKISQTSSALSEIMTAIPKTYEIKNKYKR